MDVPEYLKGENPDEDMLPLAATLTARRALTCGREYEVRLQIFRGRFADAFDAREVFDARERRLIGMLLEQPLTKLDDCLGALFSDAWNGGQLLPARDVRIELGCKFRGAQSIGRLRRRDVGAVSDVTNRQHHREYRQQREERAALRARPEQILIQPARHYRF